MRKATQDSNPIAITTPLGKDCLYLTRFEAQEGLSQLFRHEVRMHTNGTEIDPVELIGKPVSVSLKMPKDSGLPPRYFHGIVSELSSMGSRIPQEADGHLYRDYAATIVPAAWLMMHRVNCRIFQNLSMLEIVTTLLDEHDIKIKNTLGSTYPAYEYCVQYQESDWDFVSRLLETEGVLYYFEHSKDWHVLVLADSAAAFQPCVESNVIYSSGTLAQAHIHQWHGGLNITPGKYTLRGYDLLAPGQVQEKSDVGETMLRNHGEYEIFHYEAEGNLSRRADNIAELRLEGLQRNKHVRRGASNCRTFTSGKTFSFFDHEDSKEIGAGYLLTEVTLVVSVPNQSGPNQTVGPLLNNTFTCVPDNVIYRPVATVPKPIMHGVQTAVVTGDNGDEIHVDKFGRVKVQFHWDREGKHDSNSSCWIRVSQNWAGNRWGAFFFPRVGQEVLVDFLNGDPDQPIIVGAVYNARQMPPYDLPGQKTQSGIKSQSSEGASANNFNELRFEDKKGHEQVALQAEKDLNITVKHDQVAGIANHRSAEIGGNDALRVKGDRQANIGGDEQMNIGGQLTIDAGSSVTIKTGGASISMKSDGSIAIKGKSLSFEGADVSIKGDLIAIRGSQVAIN